ncbi:MAG TPA: permease, partial [Planctomycetes bacterium]|nr:permease [Planctomycetota bacterium]
GGLTVYVLYTGSDFSWMRGALTVLGFALLGAMLLGMLMGFSMGLWYSVGIVVLFAGFILYDTSQILHRLPTSMAMSGAIMLFTDVVLLFKHILILLWSSRD